MENISNKMARGSAWMISSKLVERGIGLLNTMILVRILEPDDFGLFSMAMAFLGLLTLLTSFSFDVALIQKQNADRHLYDTAWTFNVIFGVLLASLLIILATPLSQFYNEVRLEQISYFLACNCLIGGFANIGPVAFRKDLEFHKEFYYTVAKRLIGFILCISLALILRSYLALVWSLVAGKLLEVLLSYFVHPYRPRFDLSGRKELFVFSMWLFFNNTIFFAFHRMADFVISKVLGVHAMGIYSIAYELSNLPTTELVAPINRAVMPGYSKLANDPTAIRQGFLNVLSVIALCAIPAGAGIALVADTMVSVILGNKWHEAIALIQILAVSGVFVALQTNTSSLYMALGKPRYTTMIYGFHVFFLFLPALILLMKQHGLMGIAEAYLYSNLAIIPLNFFIVIRLIKLKLLAMIGVLWRPFTACLIMIGSVIYARKLIASYHIDIDEIRFVLEMDVVRLMTEIGIGASVYAMSILILWRLSCSPDGAESFLLKKVKH